MSAPSIASGSSVTLHFSLQLCDALEPFKGQVIDSNFESDPATFVLGDGNVLPGFEEHLCGCAAGDSGRVRVESEKAFGPHRQENVERFSRAEIDKILSASREQGVLESDGAQSLELTEGLMLVFTDAAKGELPGVVKQFSSETVDIDFNHPLAGCDIDFAFEIIEVSNEC